MKRNNVLRLLLLAVIIAVIIPAAAFKTAAAAPTDEILVYEITASPNTDASVTMHYHVEWKVLESDSLGPLEWVKIGVPNNNISSVEANTDNISSITYSGDGGDFLRIDFTGKYYKDEIVSFDFTVVQHNIYDNLSPDTESCTFSFTPGWFDDIAVDKLTIKWLYTDVKHFYPSAKRDGDWLIWETSLAAGDTYKIDVVYPNTIFEFPSGDDDPIYWGGGDDDWSDAAAGLAMIPALLMLISPIIIFSAIAKYLRGSGFGTTENTATTTTKKQIKKTLIKYYPVCQGCGATRAENATYCEYCGRSFIESETVISEEDVTSDNQSTKEGDFVSSTDPNVFTRIRIVNVPVVIPKSSCVHNSCVHSSCVHSSCACASHCACACACAGGGRAGCSTKDFYNTGLKLEQLKKYNKK